MVKSVPSQVDILIKEATKLSNLVRDFPLTCVFSRLGCSSPLLMTRLSCTKAGLPGCSSISQLWHEVNVHACPNPRT